MSMLHFALGNAKLRKGEAIFDLPAGHSCPFAYLCKSKSNRYTGTITDGPVTQFRCYAASIECIRSNVRRARWRNFNTLRKLKTAREMALKIMHDMPDSLRYRIHSSGDFFSQEYFDAWIIVARKCPERIFYAYTKALPFWVKRLGSIPDNFRLVASRGGTHDYLIDLHRLKSASVVFSEDEARSKGLEIDHDDSHAWQGEQDFALLLHGTQPPNTSASLAWQQIRTRGIGGYNKKRQWK